MTIDSIGECTSDQGFTTFSAALLESAVVDLISNRIAEAKKKVSFVIKNANSKSPVLYHPIMDLFVGGNMNIDQSPLMVRQKYRQTRPLGYFDRNRFLVNALGVSSTHNDKAHALLNEDRRRKRLFTHGWYGLFLSQSSLIS